MNEDSNIRKLLNRIESAHLEHMTAGVSIDFLAQTACAFLNSGGGTIIVDAVQDKKQALGRKTAIEMDMRKLIAPAAFWTVGLEEINADLYLIIDVPAGRDRPYAVDGTIYLREGAQTIKGTAAKIQTLVEKGCAETERWERQPLPGAGMDRLQNDLILETARIGRDKRNFLFANMQRTESVLADLGLFRQGTITNAAEVLFGARPAIQFPQIRSRVTVYAAHKGSDFLASHVFEGPVFEMLDQILAIVRQHTPVASLFRGGLRRIDQPAYPEEAVREGLVNAFAHRDYADFSGSVAVDLYPEKLRIWNAGQLPPGIKVGDLKREHPSMPRNPDIVQVFWLREYMERVGRGTQNIVSWCREAGLPDPSWSSDESGVSLTFKYALKTPSSSLNRRQRKLLDDLATGESIRLPAYQEQYMVSERQGRRDLKELVETGYLNREGDGPSTVFVRLDKTANPAKSGQTRPRK